MVNKSNFKLRSVLYLALIAFLILDFSVSFVQHFHQPLDGDIAEIVVPSEDLRLVLDDPLGITAVAHGNTYVNPNRFFCHWFSQFYLLSAPEFFQQFFEPIDSVYISAAALKLFVQLSLIFLLALLTIGFRGILGSDFLISAAIISSLFQTNGYRGHMGIIDTSITYAIFYALPLLILLLYFLPFLVKLFFKKEFSLPLILKFIWIPLALIVSLSGSLNPGVALVASCILLMKFMIDQYQLTRNKGETTSLIKLIKAIPGHYWFYLLPISLFSIYSLYLGKYNSLSVSSSMPISDLYAKLPMGFYYQFTQKLGFPVLIGLLLFNFFIIRKDRHGGEAKNVLSAFKWIGLFCLLYMLLLPFGGYRDYRPYILRYDTIIPVSLCLMYLTGRSMIYILKLKRKSVKLQYGYLIVILLFIFIFTNADRKIEYKNNCEREALVKIASAEESVVALTSNCTVISWEMFGSPEESKLNSELMQLWNITTDKKLYYHSEPK